MMSVLVGSLSPTDSNKDFSQENWDSFLESRCMEEGELRLEAEEPKLPWTGMLSESLFFAA